MNPSLGLAMPVLFGQPKDYRHWHSQWHPNRRFSRARALVPIGNGNRRGPSTPGGVQLMTFARSQRHGDRAGCDCPAASQRHHHDIHMVLAGGNHDCRARQQHAIDHKSVVGIPTGGPSQTEFDRQVARQVANATDSECSRVGWSFSQWLESTAVDGRDRDCRFVVTDADNRPAICLDGIDRVATASDQRERRAIAPHWAMWYTWGIAIVAKRCGTAW